MEFRTLEVFRAVATMKSFARAAEALHMTQSAVSQRILNLESELGDRLLDRTVNGATPTPKGLIMLSYAERLLNMRSELISTLSEATAVRRTVRLGVSETIAQAWLSTFIGAVSEQYPLITFEIDVDVTSNMRKRLLTHELDLVFLLGKIVEPGVENTDLSSYPLCFAASTKLKFGRQPVTLEDISHYSLVTFPRNTPMYTSLQQMFADQSLQVPQIHCSSSVSNIIKMSRDGVGIGVLSSFLIEEEVARGELAILQTEKELPVLDYWASYRVEPGIQIVAALAQIAGIVASDYASAHKQNR